MQRNVPSSAAVYGVDIGKNILHVVGLRSEGVPVRKVRFRRDTAAIFGASSAGSCGDGILRDQLISRRTPLASAQA